MNTRTALLALLLAGVSPALAQDPQASPAPPEKTQAPEEAQPAGEEKPARKRLRVQPMRWQERGKSERLGALKLALPPALLERCLIDHELRAKRGERKQLRSELRMLRTMLGANRLLFAWSSKQQVVEKTLVWKLGSASGPFVIGSSGATSGERKLYDLRTVETKVKRLPKGYRFRARLRLELGQDPYDVLVELRVRVLDPGQDVAVQHSSSWSGPYPPGKGAFPAAKPKGKPAPKDIDAPGDPDKPAKKP